MRAGSRDGGQVDTSGSPGGVRSAGPSRASGELAGQIARFGDLAGRDLAVRAFAALRARAGHDPRRHGAAREDRPLTPAEQQEMCALRAAITGDHQPADPAAGRTGPGGFPRPPRLWRLPSPGSRRAAGRHHRAADPDPA